MPAPTLAPQRIVLKPARPGLVVRDPVTLEALPPDGQKVELDSYWRRRLKDGDVVEFAASAPTPHPSPRPAEPETSKKPGKKES